MRNKYLHDENITAEQRKNALYIIETIPGADQMEEAQRIMAQLQNASDDEVDPILDNIHVSLADEGPTEQVEISTDFPETAGEIEGPQGQTCSECGDGYADDQTIAQREDMNAWMCDTCYDQAQEDSDVEEENEEFEEAADRIEEAISNRPIRQDDMYEPNPNPVYNARPPQLDPYGNIIDEGSCSSDNEITEQDLNRMTKAKLLGLAEDHDIVVSSHWTKADIRQEIFNNSEISETEEVSG
jgi:hypothetical protein